MQNNTNLALHNLVTIGAGNSVDLPDGARVTASENLAINAHPHWSQVAVIYPIQNTADAMACRDPGSWPAAPPNGKFRNADFYDNNRFFVTMVNGSPYRLSLTRKHSYQMTEFTYADVDPGFSPQFSMYYGPGTFVDTNGEAVSFSASDSAAFSHRCAGGDNDRKLTKDTSTTGSRAPAKHSRLMARQTSTTRNTSSARDMSSTACRQTGCPKDHDTSSDQGAASERLTSSSPAARRSGTGRV